MKSIILNKVKERFRFEHDFGLNNEISLEELLRTHEQPIQIYKNYELFSLKICDSKN